MLNLRRLTGLALTAALALASLGATGSACASHPTGSSAGAASMTAMTHHGLPITGDHAVAPTGCAECESPGSDAAPEPCDHAGMTGECAAMLSCASTPAEPQSPPVLRVAHASGLVAAPVSQPATLTLSPETPPPRA